MRKLSIFIATSLDGYIAKPNDDLSFLKLVEKNGEDYGYSEFTANIDTIIVGRKTYDHVLKEIGPSHYDNGQREVFVITGTERPKVGRTTFHSGELTELVKQLKAEDGLNIYCDGGAEVINELLQHDLIDEFIISIIPILVGNGTRLFKDGRPEKELEFVSATSFDTGLTQLHYKRKVIMATKRTCKHGHIFYKSTDCPTCPSCEKLKEPPSDFLALLSNPARNSLLHHGIDTIQKLSTYTEKEVLSLHGIGKKSLPTFKKALESEGLSFKQKD